MRLLVNDILTEEEKNAYAKCASYIETLYLLC